MSLYISPANMRTLEDRFQRLFNDDYAVAAENAWWDQLMTTKPSSGRKEIYSFLLTTADIVDFDEGEMKFANLLAKAFECENRRRGVEGLKLSREQIEDDEFQFAKDWAAQAGSAVAMDPQYLALELLANGQTALGYDGVAFFSNSHPINVYDAGAGTYDNLMENNPLSLDNFNKAVARMKSFKMPNGRNRNLRPSLLVAGPSNERLALEITNAAYISATSNLIATANGTKPLIINEIEDGSWYVVAQSGRAGTALNPFIYQIRRPFEMTSYTGMTQAELNRCDKFEWQVHGRSAACYGHPFQMVKSLAT